MQTQNVLAIYNSLYMFSIKNCRLDYIEERALVKNKKKEEQQRSYYAKLIDERMLQMIEGYFYCMKNKYKQSL
jgi:hypothetical protein